MNVLIIDNYDNWGHDSGVTHTILASGPRHPATEPDMAELNTLIERASVPVLGICFGHQVIARQLGGTVAAMWPRSAYQERLRAARRGVVRERAPVGDERHRAGAIRYHGIHRPDIDVAGWVDDGAPKKRVTEITIHSDWESEFLKSHVKAAKRLKEIRHTSR